MAVGRDRFTVNICFYKNCFYFWLCWVFKVWFHLREVKEWKWRCSSLKSCRTLCDPVGGRPPGSSTHGIFPIMPPLSDSCCLQTFSSCAKQGPLSSRGAWASLLGEGNVGSGAQLSICGTRAWLPRGVWNLPGLGIKPMFPALSGGFPSAVSSGKSRVFSF